MSDWRIGQVGHKCYAIELDDDCIPTGRKYDPEGISGMTARISKRQLRLTKIRARIIVDKVNARGGLKEA